MANSIKIIFLFLLPFSANAQHQNFDWYKIHSDSTSNIFIDKTQIDIKSDGVVYFWVKEEFNEPETIENIADSVSTILINYLVNNRIKRYSIKEVKYFGTNSIELAGYKYEISSDVTEIKYSTPILPGSQFQNIIAKLMEIILTDNIIPTP